MELKSRSCGKSLKVVAVPDVNFYTRYIQRSTVEPTPSKEMLALEGQASALYSRAATYATFGGNCSWWFSRRARDLTR